MKLNWNKPLNPLKKPFYFLGKYKIEGRKKKVKTLGKEREKRDSYKCSSSKERAKKGGKKTKLKTEIYMKTIEIGQGVKFYRKKLIGFMEREREIGGERRVTRYIRGRRLGF